MTTNNQSEVATQKAKIMKIWATLFSYGGKQKDSDNMIVTVVVSDRYDTAQKDADGKAVVAYDTVLKASMILPASIATTLNWTPFSSKNGKAGISARVSLYGDISLDRREGAGMKFWFNPAKRKPVVQEDGSRKWVDCDSNDPTAALMIFPVRTQQAEAEAPKAKARTENVKPVKVAEETVAVMHDTAPATAKVAALKKAVNPKKVSGESALPF